MDTRNGSRHWALPFLAGIAAGTAGLALLRVLERKRLDPTLLRGLLADRGPITPVVVVPGIMGSCLLRPDGTPVWLNLRNALGHYDLSLPFSLPLSECRDDLLPGPLLGTEAVMPRLFGFTEYADLLELLESAGFRAVPRQETGPAAQAMAEGTRPPYHVFGYDWRRDLVDSARRLHETLESLAEATGDPNARFNVIGHSMGGLVARYYLRYGAAEPDDGAPVTWAGARRIRNLVLVAVPNGGAVHALEGLLYGNRVGLSYTTLAAGVIARMPSVYQLLPPAGAPALVDHTLEPLAADLHDVATWERFGWGPFAPPVVRRLSGANANGDTQAHRGFLEAVLLRARAFHAALARPPEAPCPVRVVLLGGDCLPTLARAVVPEKQGLPPRFEPWTRKEQEAMFDAGDGRLTRASVLAQHLPAAEDDVAGCGIPEVAQAVFGSADHHGIYREPTFQSIILKLLLRPSRPARSAGLAVAEAVRRAAEAVVAPLPSGPLP